MDEVHFWRGSAERRAQQTSAIKTGQLRYFSAQLRRSSWAGRTVLDFGGNAGGLLMDEGCTIEHERYCCVDVVAEAIAAGRERFPSARFVHYDRYNCSFNPRGVVGAPIPDLGEAFDTVLAYSVFTHTSLADLRELVAQLRARLRPGGELAFTFIDPHANVEFHERRVGYTGDNLRWRLDKNRLDAPELDVDALHARAAGARWCSLLGAGDLQVEHDGDPSRHDSGCLSYHVFHTVEFMRSEFPEAEIRAPSSGEMQHCCILRG